MTAIHVELQLSDGSFASGMLKAGQSVAQFRKELERLDGNFGKLSTAARASGKEVIASVHQMETEQKSLLSTMRDISIVSGAMVQGFRMITGGSDSLLGSIISVNSQMEKLKFQMMGISSSADPMKEAAVSVEYLRDAVKKAPFSLNELSNSFVRLKSTGTDPMAGSLQAITDGVAAFGGNDESLHRIVLGLTQMSGKGVIQMEELRQQLGEAMPNAMRIMARSMGVSVAELTKAISTGRVEAGASLDLFYQELNRTYGGESQRMMQTFSGQVAQLQANLQLLATGDGLKGFFEAQKNALRDLNKFLSGDQAKAYADSFGRSLTGLVHLLEGLSQSAFSNRNAIIALAEVYVTFKGFEMMKGAIMGLITNFNLLQLSLTGSWSKLKEGGAMITLMVDGLMTGQSAATSFGLGLQGAKLAAVGMIGTISTLAPWLFAIGGVAYIVGEKFGWFGKQVKQSYEEVEKFGAKTAAEADRISKAYEADLKYQLDLKSRYAAEDGSDNADIEAIKAHIKAIQDARADMIEKGKQNESTQAAKDFDAQLEEITNQHQQEYNVRQVALDLKYQQDIADTKRTKSNADLKKQYEANTLASQQKNSQEDLDTIDRNIKAQQAARVTANAQTVAAIDAILEHLYQKRIEVAKLMAALGNFGIPEMPVMTNQQKGYNRGQKLLEGLNGSVAELKDKLQGAGGEYAKLMIRIQHGDFGSIAEGGAATQELFDQLKAATLQKEALDKLMKGDQKAQGDLENIKMKNIEDRMALEEKLSGKVMTDSERMIAKINAGFYDGLGPIEKIRADINGVVTVLGVQGEASGLAGTVIRDNTFGDQSVVRIKTVASAILDVNQAILTMNGSLGATSFSGFSTGLLGAQGGMSSFNGGILDLIASKESNRNDGYNTTLDNGKWTGGSQNLVGMTLDQIITLGNSMRTPENQAQYAGGGSSALGRYQIVGSTLKDLMQTLGLSGKELFTPEMQDRLAVQLVKQTNGDPAVMQKVWTGLQGVTPEGIAAALQRTMTQSGPTVARAAGIAGPQASTTPGVDGAVPVYPSAQILAQQTALEADQTDKTNKYIEALKQQGVIEAKNLDLTQQNARKTALDDLIAQTKAASTDVDKLGKHYAALVEAITKGDGVLGASKDPNAKEYAALIAAAQQLDYAEKSVAETRAAMKKSETDRLDISKQQVEITQQIVDEQARLKDPNYEGQSSALRALNKQLDDYVTNVGVAYGKDGIEYKNALQFKKEALNGQLLLETTQKQVALSDETRANNLALMTQGQQRQEGMRLDLDRIDKLAVTMRAAGVAEVEITAQTEAAKKAIRDKYASEGNPVIGQMEQWKDLQGNLMADSTKWLDSAAQGVTGLIMGTGDLKSTVQGILADVVNSEVKNMFATSFGDKASSAVSSKFGGFGGGNATGAKTKAAGVRHSGGMANSRGAMRQVSPMMFANAPRFHTGGIAGIVNSMPRLKAGEVPIIAKKKEGIFTEEQMASLSPVQASGSSYVINAPVSVSGSSGTHEQNMDLANAISKEMKNTMSGVVQDEIRKQTRPGGMLNSRG